MIAGERAEPAPRLIADWEMPAALMVPYAPGLLGGLLGEIADAAAKEIGVILLSPDPAAAHAFVERQEAPERFTIVAAGFDTPWIRDRAPIAVRRGDAIEWLLPRVPDLERPADDRLFAAISRKRASPLPIYLSGGNLVGNGAGLALSSERALWENGFDDLRDLGEAARMLGIERWVLFTPFAEEVTGHADVYARFLRDDLLAVACSRSRAEDAAIAERIEDEVRAAAPGIRTVRLPMRTAGQRYASPVNWIQIGAALLVPRYEMTPEEDEDEIRSVLEREGFRVRFLVSPTVDVAGSLHCLTASIYVDV